MIDFHEKLIKITEAWQRGDSLRMTNDSRNKLRFKEAWMLFGFVGCVREFRVERVGEYSFLFLANWKFIEQTRKINTVSWGISYPSCLPIIGN